MRPRGREVAKRLVLLLAAVVGAGTLAGGTGWVVKAMLEPLQTETPLPPGAELIKRTDGKLQRNDLDCGIAALVALGEFVGIDIPYDRLADSVKLTPVGSSFRELTEAAATYGLELRGYRFGAGGAMPPAPWIGHLSLGAMGHYVVVEEVRGGRVIVFDPAIGRLGYGEAAFRELWSGNALLPSR